MIKVAEIADHGAGRLCALRSAEHGRADDRAVPDGDAFDLLRPAEVQTSCRSHLRTDELLGGNALIEAGTFLAILLGTIAGGVFILTGAGIGIVSAMVLTVAVLGLLASLSIPEGAGRSTGPPARLQSPAIPGT